MAISAIIIIAAVFVLLVTFAGFVIRRERKRKHKGCLNCPYKKQCESTEPEEELDYDYELLDF